jgi:hypothetical protein
MELNRDFPWEMKYYRLSFPLTASSKEGSKETKNDG